MLIALLPEARFSPQASASAFLVPSVRGGLRLVVAPTFVPKTTIMTAKRSTTLASSGRRRSPRIAQIASSSTDGVSGGDRSTTSFFSTTSSSSNNDEPTAGRGKTSSNKKKSNKRRRSNDDDRNDDDDAPSMVPLSRSSTESTAVTTATDTSSSSEEENVKLLPPSLSRDLESKIIFGKAATNSSKSKSTTKSTTSPQPQYFVDNYVIGVDEAGRGPLAGPVVCAAVIVPMRINVTTTEEDDGDGEDNDDPFHPTNLRGVVDSKKLTKEEDREQVYEQLMMMSQPSPQSQPCIRWAVSVIDANRIDEINILQATMEGMRSAIQSVMGLDATSFNIEDLQKNKKKKSIRKNKNGQKSTIEEEKPVVEETTAPDPPSPPPAIIRQVQSASVEEKGCYIVTSDSIVSDKTSSNDINAQYYTLVDGNRLPHDMPCDGESVVKGDSKEFCIAAASIFAKVTRDRLMRHYDKLYPQYNLEQHKGYPTAAHMSAVKQHGASPIHRLTFAPLKHMEFDDDGNIIAS
mmetsp:Transcript_45008/g.109381  ORF Transcript_45008/g.109381 Transcript_45008/m.109381 type:complete len:518 (+) Transcript_45008:132-1685(+)